MHEGVAIPGSNAVDLVHERGGSGVECQTRNRESPGSNPL